ncbi:MAG: pyruvate synthase subunit beta, partial [Candidatus Lokiarchaeota archaeon]|nr:pyruvate synthase subunit beta [Candidatus Lokiarchaeota archaeon]
MDIPEEEMFYPGTRLCGGCGPQLAYRIILKALGPKTIVTVPASCMTVLHGMQGATPVRVPVLNTTFETVAAAASGISASLKNQGLDKEITVMAIAGDGGTVDIGIQGLSGAAERETDIIFCCYDNEAYMNTGVQRSGSTPYGALTTTTPIIGKMKHKKNMAAIMEAHGLSYIATASASYPRDLFMKFQKAKEMRNQGVRYIHVFTPCPPGWGHDTNATVEIGRLAVETGFWPLFEIINGEMVISRPSKRFSKPENRKPIQEYLGKQRRFKKVNKAGITEINNYIDSLWKKINDR